MATGAYMVSIMSLGNHSHTPRNVVRVEPPVQRPKYGFPQYPARKTTRWPAQWHRIQRLSRKCHLHLLSASSDEHESAPFVLVCSGLFVICHHQRLRQFVIVEAPSNLRIAGRHCLATYQRRRALSAKSKDQTHPNRKMYYHCAV